MKREEEAGWSDVCQSVWQVGGWAGGLFRRGESFWKCKSP